MNAYTQDNKLAFWAELYQGVTSTVPSATVASTLRSGFLQASTNTASTTTTEIANVGHVFGRMGQGERTMSTYTLNGATITNTSFQWKAPADNAHAMMINILPTAPEDAGLSATKRIKIETKLLAFAAAADLQIPVQPAAATATDKVASANYLILSTATVVAMVGMTIY